MSNKSESKLSFNLSYLGSGSCHIGTVKLPNDQTIKFVVNCGILKKDSDVKYNSTFEANPDQIDFVLISNNHPDHIGRLPLLVKLGLKSTIYTTKFSTASIPKSLKGKHLSEPEKTSKRNGRSARYKNSDVKTAVKLIEVVPYLEEIQPHENIHVTFLNNSYLPGAAAILVKISYPGEKDINLLFTSNCSVHSSFFDIAPTPKDILDLPLIVIQESNYEKEHIDGIAEVFEENVMRAIGENKTVIIPFDSQGKLDEIILKIKHLQRSTKSNETIYLDSPKCIEFKEEFLPKNFKFVDQENREDLLSNTECKIILVSCGVESYGPVPTYISKYISSYNTLIHFVGYSPEGTIQRKIKNTAKKDLVKIDGIKLKKNCDVECTNEFSPYSTLDDISLFLKQFSNIKLLLINNGTEKDKENLVNQAKILNLSQTIEIESRSFFYRINSYGSFKKFPTKF